MADPVTWMAIAAAAGTTISAVGAIRQGQAQQNAMNYNVQVATQNQQIAASESEAAAGILKQQTEKQIGAATAAYGASGVDPSQGSASDVLQESARSATLNMLTTKYNYKLKGLGFQNQADLDKSNASNASSAAMLGALGTAFSGYSKAYGMYPSTGGQLSDSPNSAPSGMNYPGT